MVRLSLRELEVLAAVIEHRSISASGRVLHLSQPAVTRYIRKLEQTLGVALLERTSRGIVPTGAGELLGRHARAIAAELRSAQDELASLRGVGASSVRIGTTIAVSHLVAEVVQQVAADHPNVAVTLVEGLRRDLAPALLSGALDMIVSPLGEVGNAGPGVIEEVVGYNKLEVVGRWAHPLSRRRRITLQDLRPFGWILPPPGSAPRAQLENAFSQAGLGPPRGGVETSSPSVIREMLLGSDWLALLVREAVRFDEEARLLRCLAAPLHIPARPIGLITRAGHVPSSMATRVMELLRCAGGRPPIDSARRVARR